MNKHSWYRTCWGATLIGGMLLWTSACLPPGFLDGLDFGQFELFSHSSCSSLEDSLKQRALGEAQYRALAANGSSSYNPNGYASIGARDLSDKSNSTTNNQEEGVDEADIFKVDDKYAYALHGKALVIVEAGANAKQVSWTQIEGSPFDMFIHGDRALVMLRTNHNEVKGVFSGEANADVPDRDDNFQVVKAALYDITDRTKPTLKRELFVEGEYLSSRRVGERAYIVTKSMLGGPVTEEPSNGDANWLSRRKTAINNAKLSDWLPYYYDIRYTEAGEVEEADSGSCSCKDTWESPSGTGDDALAIYSIGLDKGESSVETAAVIGDGATVYGSQKGMVVAMTNYAEKTYGSNDDGFSVSDNKTGQVTHLHRFALSETGKVNYEASGQVDGWILNQFSISEYKNVLRVGTMIGSNGDPDVETAVFTLKLDSKSDALFSSKSNKKNYLKVVGELRGIGYGEDLYAIRFKEDVGYVVTFLETDPLWTIDMSNPNSPRILGELMVPGYSTYLHPINNGKLLGVGRADWLDDEGIKLSLFDVSDLTNPKAVEEVVAGDFNSSTEVTNTHKAFHWIEDHQLMAIPMVHSEYSGLLLYKVESNGLRFMNSIKHNDMVDSSGSTWPSVLRSQRIGNHLYSYSRSGIAITDLNTLNNIAKVDLDDM